MNNKTKKIRDWAYGIATAIAWIVLTYSICMSTTHIVETSLKIGLTGIAAYTSPLLVDAVFALGKLGRAERFDAKTRRASMWLMLFGGAMSLTANIVAGANTGQRIHGILVVVVMVAIESHAARIAGQRRRAANAVAMVAKAEADADLANAVATAMAVAAADLAQAVADAMATTEARVRAELAAEAKALVEEAERATREAADAATAARVEADRRERERVTAQRLAAAEAERVRLAAELAKAAADAAAKTPAKPVAKVASVANMATVRVASGQASAVAMAILVTDPTLSDEDVVRMATERGEVTSTRTARRVRRQMAELVAA